jgi:hypothetical protein
MQLICPHCGAPVSAENINIQRMAAVCAACDTVFQFDPAEPRHKRRKIKQPRDIQSAETDAGLRIAFRTNFRLDRNEGFLAAAIMSFVFTFITAMMIAASRAKPEITLFILGFGLVTLFFYYTLGLVAYNKTIIEVDDEQISISRKPLPNLLSQPQTISLAGVEKIRYEETAASRKEDYDIPRYHVWADMVEGKRKPIVTDVIEDYAVFVSQRLNEYLDLDTAPDTTRLQDEEGTADSYASDVSVTQPESSRNGS